MLATVIRPSVTFGSGGGGVGGCCCLTLGCAAGPVGMATPRNCTGRASLIIAASLSLLPGLSGLSGLPVDATCIETSKRCS